MTNETLIISMFAANIVLAGITFMFIRNTKKSIPLELQRCINESIERQLLTSDVKTLLKHSDHSLLAQRIAERIKELIDYGASPDSLYRLFKRLGITRWIDKPQGAEGQFLQAIQSVLYESLDTIDMGSWMRTSGKNDQEHWDLLKGTFLSKVRHNGFIMDLKLS